MSEAIHALVIDDDRLSGLVLEKLLVTEGVTVTLLDHPNQLEETLPQLPAVQVVFVDLELPLYDGYEVLDILRAQLGDGIPMVAYTVHTSESVAARQKGFDSFIGKPVNRQDFPANLRRILNGERVWAIS